MTFMPEAHAPSRPEEYPDLIDLSVPDNSELVRGRSVVLEAAWMLASALVMRPSWIPFSGLKCWLLRLFGARIGRGVYIKPGVQIKFPWYLVIGDYSWIGENSWIDNLAEVHIGQHCCISQGVYLCTGNHDWSVRNMRLFRRPITLKRGSWVGARCFVGPGVTVHEYGIATAGAVVVRDIPAFEIHAGNPAQYLKRRVIAGAERN
jgi:putative colanic acid biosynthesis acetyltransferase WcaF